MGPDDIAAFLYGYLPSFVIAILACATIFGITLYRRRQKISNVYFAWLILVPAICWSVYFICTAEFAWTTTMLNSESSKFAERIYNERFRVQVQRVDQAIRVAINSHEAPNVRFYASCLIADMLSTNSDAAVRETLDQINEAPVIRTEFLDGNNLTAGFYYPGRPQPELTVGEIVTKRLQKLKESSQ